MTLEKVDKRTLKLPQGSEQTLCKSKEQIVRIKLKSLILAQIERWRHA